MTLLRTLCKRLDKTKPEIVEDLRYFLKMPFVAQNIENDYFDIIKPFYHKATGLHANNISEPFKWTLKQLT